MAAGTKFTNSINTALSGFVSYKVGIFMTTLPHTRYYVTMPDRTYVLQSTIALI
jgi:hypothetical protein